MKRQIWALAEAWVTVWLEAGGAKTGDPLLEAKYIRNLSLSERLTILRKQQPGQANESAVVNGGQNTFTMGKDYLSKAETTAVTNPANTYWIEVSLVNPMYDDSQVDDNHPLQGCTISNKGFTAKDDEVFEEEVVYDVETVG